MDIARQALAIAFVFALLGVALWLLRRKGLAGITRARPAGPLTLSGRLTLGPQHAVHLVRIGDHNLVLGVCPNGITLLCDLDRPVTTVSTSET